MTRNQIKSTIEDIIDKTAKLQRDGEFIWNTSEIAEKIMKLWDQGFVYDLPKKKGCRCDS